MMGCRTTDAFKSGDHYANSC